MKNKPSHFQNRDFWIRVAWQSLCLLTLAVVLGLTTNWLRHPRLPLFSSQPVLETLPGQGTDSLIISLNEAEDLYFSHSALFLDARPKEFYEMGHIAGAKNLPYEEFNKLFPLVMKGVDRNTTIVTYCDGEHCQLSKHLALALMEKGYMNVYVLENGWTVWKEANLPVEVPAQEPVR